MPRKKADISEFIRWLWAYRAEHQIETRRELAQLLGVPETTMNQWFNKGSQPSLSAIGSIARATGESAVALARMAGYEHEIAERAGVFAEDPYERMARKLRAYDKIPAAEREHLIELLKQDKQEYQAAINKHDTPQYAL